MSRLDPALLRPGRVDVIAHFSLATAKQAEGMFLKFFANEKALAQKFAKEVKPDSISMAQLQGHFVLYKENALLAAEKVGDLKPFGEMRDAEVKKSEKESKASGMETVIK
jgi:chaperone BCS1